MVTVDQAIAVNILARFVLVVLTADAFGVIKIFLRRSFYEFARINCLPQSA